MKIKDENIDLILEALFLAAEFCNAAWAGDIPRDKIPNMLKDEEGKLHQTIHNREKYSKLARDIEGKRDV